MNARQARIKRLKEAFQKVEQLMKEGHAIQWDEGAVTGLSWLGGLSLIHDEELYFKTDIYYENEEEWLDMADLSIEAINRELSERLTVWKKVEVKL